MKNPQQTSYSSGKRLKAFSVSSGTRQGCPLSLLFNIVLEVCSQSKKKVTVIPTGERAVKLSVFADDVLLYVGNPLKTQKKKKLFELNTLIQQSIRIQCQCSKIHFYT